MIQIEVQSSADKTERALVRVGKKAGELTVPLKKSGVWMMSSVDKNFEVQGRPVKWMQLSQMTKDLRRHKGSLGVFRILEDTGRLRKSITMALTGDGASVKVGTSFPYARLLHFGGKVRTPAITIIPKTKSALKFTRGGKVIFATKVKIPSIVRETPSRPFILFQVPDDIEAIESIFSDHIQGVLDAGVSEK